MCVDFRFSKMQIIHIVRRYGLVGGMERYVWETTLKLRDLNHDVIVICQACMEEVPAGITVHQLGSFMKRPRWLSSLRFSLAVKSWLAKNPHANAIIHSHERLSIHHITTFHSPPFANVLRKHWWQLLSLRIWAQLYLERRELTVARFIVPNSITIKQQLADYYPRLAHKLTAPIMPGVNVLAQRTFRIAPSNGGVIGFIGQEWKRKNLRFAITVIEKLRQTRPNLQFIVVGPEINDIKTLFANWNGGYLLAGWSNKEYLSKFDVLLHPAIAEPYGMVISEAMAANVPVVVSDVCGAVPQIAHGAGDILSLSAPVESWSEAINKQLNRTEALPVFTRTWQSVANEYINIYLQLPNQKP